MSIQQLVYQSVPVFPLDCSQLDEWLLHWRHHNLQRGISGLLLVADEAIIQVIEGPAPAVHALYEVIARDPRHYDVITLADGPVAERTFADWSMGYAPLDAPLNQCLAAYADPARLARTLTPRPGHSPELTALLRDFVSSQTVLG